MLKKKTKTKNNPNTTTQNVLWDSSGRGLEQTSVGLEEQSGGGKGSGLTANLSGNVTTWWWQRGQKEAAGGADCCPLSAACAVLVDPCPEQELLACSWGRLATCLGGCYLKKARQDKTAKLRSCSGHYFCFLTRRVISLFRKSVSDSTNLVELNCFPLQMSELYRAFWHPASSLNPKREDVIEQDASETLLCSLFLPYSLYVPNSLAPKHHMSNV